MKTPWQTSFVAILLATFLFGSNVLGLHALTHDNTIDHNIDCEYCTFLVQKELHDAFAFNTPSFQHYTVTENFALIISDYSVISIKEVSLSTFYTRPPPFSI